MGSNKNKKKEAAPVQQAVTRKGGQSPISPNNPIFQESGNDERGRIQNRIVDEQSRYRGQMDPYMNALGEGFGGAMERGQQDYGDIMNRFSGMASGQNPIQARSVSYTDPFKSYGDFEGLSKTGGYSPTDIADLRARGVAPIRAAYANAEQGVSRQRALQGGYSPNATAVLAKMAREQSQGGADALQNVNAGIIADRNRGQLAGMQGMSGIEGQRLNAQIDTGKFNADAAMMADRYNNADQLNALQGMSSLYGTTPGMANMFGTQLGNAINNSGQQGSSYINAEDSAQNRPGRYENTKQYINDAATMANPFLEYLKKRQPTTGGTTYTPQQGGYNIPVFGGNTGINGGATIPKVKF